MGVLPGPPAPLGPFWNSLGACVTMQAAGTQSTDHSMTRREKDDELDRRIVALRKKNQALLQRYQEIEEDRRQAEQGHVTVTTPEPPPSHDLIVTISQAPGGKRVVSRNWARGSLGPGATFGMLKEEEAEAHAWCTGEWVELAVTMENKAKGKRIVREKPSRARSQRAETTPGAQGPSTQTPISVDSAQKATQHTPWGQDPASCQPSGELPGMGWDYTQWKQEREHVDQARLARHQDAQGDWRRPWDLDKDKPMSQARSKPWEEGVAKESSARGPRSRPRSRPRKPLPPAPGPAGEGEPGEAARAPGPGARHGDTVVGRPSGASGVPATRSRARGAERLTGRARRWDETEDQHVLENQEQSQGPRRSLGKKSEAQEEQTEQAKTSDRPAPPEGLPEASDSSLTSLVPNCDSTPLDLSLNWSDSSRSKEGTCMLSPAGGQQSPVSCPEAEPKVHTCPESQREPGSQGVRDEGQTVGQQGLVPQNRALRGSGWVRASGSVRGRTRAVGPAEKR